MSVKLLVADHQEVMRAGLRTLVAGSPFTVVAEANNEKEAMRLVQKHSPEVVILDVRFAGEDGFATLARLKRRFPQIGVVMWSTDDNPTYIARAMALKAGGYLPRSIGRRELLRMIKIVADGKDAWSADQLRAFKGAPTLPPQCPVALTPRECEVLRQLAHGLSNKELAAALEISYETVKEHVQHILRKLDAKDRTQAAVWAVKNGFTEA